MPKLTVKEAQEALDMISIGLLRLEQGTVESLTGKHYIDTVARMNANCQTLQNILDPLKLQVKAMGTNGKPTEYIRGSLFKAVLSRYKKAYFDFDKAERLLGKKRFKSCWIKRDEESLRFDIQG